MTIRTGIGGWTHAEWRGSFFPPGLRRKDELAHAASRLGAIEINATFYRLQKPASFAQWRDATPEGFVFTVKGSRYVTNRKVLAEAGEGVTTFMAQGLIELGDRLGPIVWQLPKTKRFDADDIRAFLAFLPKTYGGLAIRHAIEIGHDSFACAEFVALARAAGVAIVWSDETGRAAIADRTADFSYLRLQGMHPECRTGYTQSELARLATICRGWEAGDPAPRLPYAGDVAESRGLPGDVFAFLINGAVERAPAAALALADIVCTDRSLAIR